jgi:alpha-mannosidase
MYMGKFPLPEATIYSRALRNASEADTHDNGVVYMDTVEPGLTGNYIYDFALSSEGVFDPVAAWRLGSDFNLPLIAKFTQNAPAVLNRSFFTIDQPNVQIVDIKPLSDNVIRGEVSSAPLDPPRNREFIIRLQEFTGKAATVRLTMPTTIKTASLVSMTEDKTIGPINQISPLTVSLRPFQTATIKVVIEYNDL